MNTSSYGTMGSSLDPKQFVLQLLKKVMLNNKNALKFSEANDYLGIVQRFSNSVHCLEELNMSLNRDEENPVVNRVSMHYQVMIDLFEEILSEIEEDSFDLEKFNKGIDASNVILNNLYEGFSGLNDE